MYLVDTFGTSASQGSARRHCASIRAVAVTAKTVGNRAVLSNEDGEWHVWLRLMRNPQTGAVVGPGHIGRVVAADGARIVDDFFHDDVNLNDTRNGGLGSFGCHLSRRT